MKKTSNCEKPVFAFTNLDQDWWRKAKEKELRKEKQEEEYAAYLEVDNEPLLSQQHQVDSQFSLNHDNQLLLSGHNVTQDPPKKQEAEQKNIFKKYDQKYIQVNIPSQEPQPVQSLQQITAQIDQIVNDEGNVAQRTQRGAKLLKDHFNLLFFNPLSDIGNQILSDGYSVVNLMKIILLKETEEALKTLLCKYLILTFTSKVATNKQVLLDYQRAMVPSRPSKASVSIENQRRILPPPSQPSVPVVNQIRVLPPPSQPSVEAPNSVRAVDGSNSKQQPQQPMVIEDMLPVKRTIKSQKRKVTFEEQSEKKQISGSKSVRKHRYIGYDLQKNNKNYKKYLGSKFTIDEKRFSQRLAKKGSSSKQKSGPSSTQSKRSSLRKANSSKKKHYDEEHVNVSSLKNHLKEINVNDTMMESDFRALNHQDQQIMKLLHLADQIAAEESNSQRCSSQIAENYVGHEEDTVSSQQSQISQISRRSQRSPVSNTHSLARKEEFKRNISKYKGGDIPIIILRIVDPDINDHGIYALLELGKISQLVYNARYALTPITDLVRASKKDIDEDYAQAQRQVGEDDKHNIAYIRHTRKTLDLIRPEKDRRQDGEA